MRWPALRILWGIFLVLAGILFLLNTLGFITIGEYLWAIILGVGGLAFLSVFVADRKQWWSLFPGFALLVGGAIIFLERTYPSLPDDFGGIIAMGGIGLAFLIVFLMNTENWWALIPAGSLFSIALAIGLNQILTGLEIGGVFLIGLGFTFGVVGFVPTPQGRMRWALIPALILIVVGFLVLIAASNLISYLWPLGLIALGGLIIYSVIRSRQKSSIY
jgi:hypothetical protein